MTFSMTHVVAAATAGVAATLAAVYLFQSRKRTEQHAAWVDTFRDLRPPFPAEIVRLLDSASLCYLSTTLDNSPHLSLMNFTYHRPTEQIIFTTRRDTQKTAPGMWINGVHTASAQWMYSD